MKTSGELFEINIEVDDIELVNFQTLRPLKFFKNIYQFPIDQLRADSSITQVMIVEKKIGVILGYFKFRVSTDGEPLSASQYFDTFSLQRLDLCCLEVNEIRIAEPAWQRLGFRNALIRAFSELMSQMGSEILLVHYCEKISSAISSFQRVHRSALRSIHFFCDSLTETTLRKPLSSGLIGQESVDSLPLSLTNLLQAGLEICSDAIIDEANQEVTLLLGQISARAIRESRLLSQIQTYARRNADATL